LIFEAEGEAIQLHCAGNYLVAMTAKNYIKCWNLSRRNAEGHGNARIIEEQA
jgi:hypothetical protein